MKSNIDLLSIFSEKQVSTIQRKIRYSEPTSPSVWPSLHKVVVILFSSRTGSTALCRRLQQVFELGEVGEVMNPPNIVAVMQRAKLSSHEQAVVHTIERCARSGQFVYKAGVPGLIVSALAGLSQNYMPNTRFALLVRRDVVAQAISLVKANTTGQFHSTQEQREQIGVHDYNYNEISKQIQIIYRVNRTLKDYLKVTGIVAPRIYYENFEEGDYSTVLPVFENFGLMRRTASDPGVVREVTKLDRSINTVWRERFLSELSDRDEMMLRDYWTEIIEAPI